EALRPDRPADRDRRGRRRSRPHRARSRRHRGRGGSRARAGRPDRPVGQCLHSQAAHAVRVGVARSRRGDPPEARLSAEGIRADEPRRLPRDVRPGSRLGGVPGQDGRDRSGHPRGGRRGNPGPQASEDVPRPHRRRGSPRPDSLCSTRSLVLHLQALRTTEGQGVHRNVKVAFPLSPRERAGVRGVLLFLTLLTAPVCLFALDFPVLTPSAAMFRAHREAFLSKLPAGSVAIIRSAPERTFSHDTEYPYRQDSDFYYLTGLEEPDSIAVLRPGASNGKSYVLFVRPHDARRETWQGARPGPDRPTKTHA